MTALGDHLVTTVDLPPPPSALTPDQLTNTTRNELIAKLAEREREFGRNKAYLDQLLSVVIEHKPQLLAIVGEAQQLR